MSQPLPCGRGTPRWSVVTGFPLVSVQELRGTAFTAGLVASRATVWVGPPLIYELTSEYDLCKVLPKNFFVLLDSYQDHPEAKSLGPNGNPCEFGTRGQLQRAHVVAKSPPIYIGKESDRHWEEGEDLSLLEFKAIQYKRRGNMVATEEQLARIAKIPKREFMRRGINQHTLEKICQRKQVRAAKLMECLKALEEYERKNSFSEMENSPCLTKT